jgi:hypothetical protein
MQIDHINGDKLDNRIVNLREATPEMNQQNKRSAPINSGAGLLGVHRSRKRWRARIELGGRKFNLGSFDDPKVAAEAYLAAKKVIHEGFIP